MIFGTPPIITNGLVLHLDAGSRQSYVSGSTTWGDLSGNGNTGTLTNGPTFNNANQGSIVFDQVNDIVSFSGVALTNTHTVNMWIYPTSSDDYSTLFSQGQSTGIWYRGLTDKITFYYSGSDHLSNFTITKNQWTNITVTCSSGNVNFYKNNTLDSATYTGGTGYTGNSIGDDTNTESYGGRVATLHVYNRALSAQEINQNYNALKSRFGLT